MRQYLNFLGFGGEFEAAYQIKFAEELFLGEILISEAFGQSSVLPGGCLLLLGQAGKEVS